MYGWGRWEGQTLAGCWLKSEKTRKVRDRMSSLLNILESIFSLILKLIFFEIFYSRQYVIISSARNVRQFQKWMNHKIWIYITPIWSLMSIYCWIQQYILIRSHTTNKNDAIQQPIWCHTTTNMMPYNKQNTSNTKNHAWALLILVYLSPLFRGSANSRVHYLLP